MRGEQYLTRKTQFDNVYASGKTWTDRQLVMKAAPNNLESTRYGFTISRRVGKAVVRNKIKRRLREIMRHSGLKAGWDIVFIARVPASGADYQALEKSVKNLLDRADLIAGKNENIGPGTD